MFSSFKYQRKSISFQATNSQKLSVCPKRRTKQKGITLSNQKHKDSKQKRKISLTQKTRQKSISATKINNSNKYRLGCFNQCQEDVCKDDKLELNFDDTDYHEIQKTIHLNNKNRAVKYSKQTKINSNISTPINKILHLENEQDCASTQVHRKSQNKIHIFGSTQMSSNNSTQYSYNIHYPLVSKFF